MASSSTAPVLALPSAGYGQGASWRKNEDLIDALPYIDTMTPELKKQVDALIDAELRAAPASSLKPADYLAAFPPLPPLRFQGHPLLAAEYERVKSGAPMPPLDVTRFRLDPPAPARRNDAGAWRAALDNACAQLEHQGVRVANLELLLKYGDKAWRAQTSRTEAALRGVEAQTAATRAATHALNQQRKLGQTAAGGELRKAGGEYAGLCTKNAQIQAACEEVEAEVDALKAALGMVPGTAGAAGAGQEGEEGEEGQGAPDALAADGPSVADVAMGEQGEGGQQGEGQAEAQEGDAMEE